MIAKSKEFITNWIMTWALHATLSMSSCKQQPQAAVQMALDQVDRRLKANHMCSVKLGKKNLLTLGSMQKMGVTVHLIHLT